MKKKIAALLLAVLMIVSLAACGGSSKYTVGICQIVQHPALDAATQGFKDALTEKLGDKVVFDEQNANGDPATCATICNQFVSSKVSLIMANATPSLQAAQAATNKIPVLGHLRQPTTVRPLGSTTGRARPARTSPARPDLAPLDEQAAMLKEIFPDAQNVGILYCSAEPNSKYQDQVISGLPDRYGCTMSRPIPSQTPTTCKRL